MVAVVAVAVGGWLLLRPTPVTMDVAGATVTNQDEVLSTAEA